MILFTTTDLDPRFSSSHVSFSTAIQVQDPYGRLLQVVVPNGVYAGQMFMIQV